ncbi:hypothetical protein [Runella sp.]|uniref:hypothetical protein n=1 Tax=Runella sp. TaxID=1960881 RepID=UPI003D11D4D9
MSDAYLIQISELQKITTSKQVVAALNLPAGKYLIFGKANAAAMKLNGTIDFNQPFGCTLVCGTTEDKCGGNLYSNASEGGNWGTVALNIGVTLEADGRVEMQCTPGNPGCILFFEVVISAIKVENLTIIHLIPPGESRFSTRSDFEKIHFAINLDELKVKI